LVTTAPPASGQHPQRIDLGEWVRLSTRQLGTEPDWVVGALAASTDMYLVVEPIAAGPLAIPHQSLTRVEVQRGWSSRAWPAGLLGAVAGLAASTTLGMMAGCLPSCILIGTPFAAGVGTLLGARDMRMRWEAVSPLLIRPNTQARATPTLGITVVLAF
jgi:hypothetical protein